MEEEEAPVRARKERERKGKREGKRTLTHSLPSLLFSQCWLRSPSGRRIIVCACGGDAIPFKTHCTKQRHMRCFSRSFYVPK